MTTVFLGGSRRLSRLNSQVRERILGLVSRQFTILVGDANGADKAMQVLLANEGYKNVHVYCMEGECRNNIGNWPTVVVRTDREKKGFAFYAQKDAEMSRRADYGLMLWDGKSKGTLNNMLNLIQQGKRALVYFSPAKTFIPVKGLTDIEHLVAQCDPEARRVFEQALRLDQRTSSQRAIEFA